ncbi:MAG: sodium-independent anion transporter [Gammaproteobacteria bacterium]|nr:MAG: sodium-independent anion transporter [Gammaproteobacteria bacterium]
MKHIGLKKVKSGKSDSTTIKVSGTGYVYSLLTQLFPFLLWLPKVNSETLKIDAYAGLTSAIFALPQGLAFALIAGLPPEFGLYAAIVAPVVSALFGSSWHTVSGPTVATSIVVISIISEYAVPQSPQFIGFVLILTLLAGIIQLTLGIFRLGHIVDFISHTVILGFSTGAALLIMGNQLSNVLGISFPRQENLAMSLYAVYHHLAEFNGGILFIAATTLIVSVLCKKYYPKLPYLLVAMIYGAVSALVMGSFFGIQSINMVGALPSGLPSIITPEMTWFQAREFFASAIAIATLGLIQCVSIAKTIATKSDQHIDANREFIGQGLSNIACSFTSGFFSSSSFTRTGVNYAAGAKTPMSSIIASGLILLMLLFAANVTAFLPTASMSAIIIIIGWGLIDFTHIKKILKTSRSETAVFITTLLSTLLLSLEFAIYSGMFLSLIMYLQKTSQPKVSKYTIDTLDPYQRLIPLKPGKKTLHPSLSIIRIDGSIFFGSVDHIRNMFDSFGVSDKKNVLLICSGVGLIDISGAELLLLIKKNCQKRGGDLYLSGLVPAVRRYLLKSPYWEQLDRRNIFNYKSEAVSYILNLIEEQNAARTDSKNKTKQKEVEKTLIETST